MATFINGPRFVLGFAILALIAVSATPARTQLAGGLGGEKMADEDVRQLVETLKCSITDTNGRPYESLEPLSYKTQVVAGTNYFIKIKATEVEGRVSIIQVKVYEPIRAAPRVTGLLRDQAQEAPINYF